MPKTFVRGDKAFQGAAAVLFRRHAAAGEHGFERLKKLLGDAEVLGIAGVMESYQDFIREPPSVARACRATPIPGIRGAQVVVNKLVHLRPAMWTAHDSASRDEL